MVARSLTLAREFVPLNVGLDALVQEAKRIQQKEAMTVEDIQAFELFYRAATAGHAEAQCHLSSCYALGNGVQKNTKRALKWLQRSAEQISRCRTIRLRVFYATGLMDLSQDSIEAANWYRSAAEQGSAQEQFEIGECYRKGIEVPQDYYEAAQWYHKAAKQGYADAQYKLGLYFRGGERDGFYEHVTVGLANAFLGEKLPFDVLNAKTGEIIIAANQQITRTLLRKLAKDYDQCDIAPSPVRDKLREIIAKCDKGAVVWFQRAAEQGHADAQRNLALCKDSTASFTEKYSAPQ
jgi:TPR repeat protein